MKAGFLRSPTGEVVSALIPKTSMPSVFLEGETAVLLQPLDLSPMAIVATGTMLMIEWCDRDTGAVAIVFNAPVPGLHEWGNTLILVPFSTDDALSALNAALKWSPNCVLSVEEYAPDAGPTGDIFDRYAQYRELEQT